MDSLEKLSNKYITKIREQLAKVKYVRIQWFNELKEHTEKLKKQLMECRELENNNENSPAMAQALAGRCITNVHCRMQNLFNEINIKITDLVLMNIKGNLLYFSGEDCDQMISFL